ncbi:hypothetical protein IU470_29890 [Nocardia abscessus]|uniref:Uncharacterized protein n=1 Tax=Nocardia abscessus TaxID=120957 RepID=A0ABS0CL35_9NOCA|nr:hypothetical protein [Nocardia abscessus]MBF6229289.1 hypothetical protein [Nocardia abscessus]
MADLQEIGAHRKWLSTGIAPSDHEFLLSTGQRVELVSLEPIPARGRDPRMPEIAGRVVGENAVRRRLAEIAAGLSSLIVGEGFVLRQVESASQLLPEGHPCKPVVADSVALARRLRDETGLVAALDYPAAALTALAERAEPAGRTLLVVGGGMLGQAVAEQAGSAGYTQALIVTRTPSRLRRSLAGTTHPISLSRADGAREMLGTRHWDAVIATTTHDEGYRARIKTLIDAPECVGAVDLSGVPLRAQLTDRYQHMYGPRFTSLVHKQNRYVARRADLVRRRIAESIGQQR